MSEKAEPFVVAVIATFRRPKELAALLDSLGKIPRHLRAAVIVDNAAQEEIRALAERSGLSATYLPTERNLGCGGGLHAGEKVALEKFPALTHLWILDDDCIVTPGCLAILLETMAGTGAAAVHPLTENSEGRLCWFPGLEDARKFQVARSYPTPDEFLARCGEAPIPFSWCQGIALLVTREALDRLGLHRTDYWVRGEDLEFSLRLTHRFTGLYVPRARVRHLPPTASADPAAEFAKHRAMLRNLAYTAFRLPHGRRLLRTLPGNWWRFLRAWGPGGLPAVLQSAWEGAVLGRPARAA